MTVYPGSVEVDYKSNRVVRVAAANVSIKR